MVKRVNEAMAAYLSEAAPGVGNFEVTLRWQAENGGVDQKSQRTIMAKAVMPLVVAAHSVTVFEAKFSHGDFYGDGDALLPRIKRGRAEIPQADREWFAALNNYWAGRSSVPPNPNTWRGDIAVVLRRGAFDAEKFFSNASNPMVISNYRSGMARASVKLLDQFGSGERDDEILLLFPGASTPAGVFVSAKIGMVRELVKSAIENCSSTIELYHASIPPSQVESRVRASRSEARELVSRLRNGKRPNSRVVE